MRITTDNALLLIIDIQERLTPHISGYEQIVAKTARVIQGAAELEVPIIVNEQYKKGLGDTIAELETLLADYPHFEKVTFSGVDDDATLEAIRQQDKKYVVICGIETHVCIMQTALDLLEANYQPVIVVDAVGSRFDIDDEVALKRLSQAGVVLTTSESILFELCRSSKAPVFKAISRLVK